jgi:Cytochrome P450
MYDLAVHPEYHAPLREEIETLVAEEGWKKSTVMKMRKLDSFLKESIRMHPIGQGIPPPSTSGLGVDVQQSVRDVVF